MPDLRDMTDEALRQYAAGFTDGLYHEDGITELARRLAFERKVSERLADAFGYECRDFGEEPSRASERLLAAARTAIEKEEGL